ncbi:hypothetical protein AVEN_139008-1 [Araneus ventricosus]|uniref:Uncharacterized protein n=1 Tax=Araneus ventricosus TaxID=182803 RepID=A0A4Y2USF0_ARAVE|nr:hypothetical protein AVEN_139008-1 [Araneus ventricosus]
MSPLFSPTGRPSQPKSPSEQHKMSLEDESPGGDSSTTPLAFEGNMFKKRGKRIDRDEKKVNRPRAVSVVLVCKSEIGTDTTNRRYGPRVSRKHLRWKVSLW